MDAGKGFYRQVEFRLGLVADRDLERLRLAIEQRCFLFNRFAGAAIDKRLIRVDT
jgi:hypothetical protein